MQIYASNSTGYDSVIEPSYMTQFQNQHSGKPSTLIEKSITENGEYSASSDNADGYSTVTVNVSGGGAELAALIDRTIVSITIPDGTTEIGAQAFFSCNKLTEVIIPESVTSIGTYAFNNCMKLTEITIPASVTTIANTAFYACTGLTKIIINKAEGSITGAPWGAPMSPQIVWTG